MKQLQNNFTTPEQSKRLLELGVPADSANCVRVVRTGMVFFVQDGKVTKDYLSIYKSARGEEAEPCWSVGRLMEILDICALQDSSGLDGEEYPSTTKIMKNLHIDYVEYLFKTIELSIQLRLINISKLEE